MRLGSGPHALQTWHVILLQPLGATQQITLARRLEPGILLQLEHLPPLLNMESLAALRSQSRHPRQLTLTQFILSSSQVSPLASISPLCPGRARTNSGMPPALLN